MYRTLVILRHTFVEAVVQPIYPLLLLIGSVILFVFALLPFFTLGEDTIMFKSVGLDVILLLVLICTLFAASKSVYEEIEDRTMLTLMSKPVARWEVLLGKYLGLLCSAALAVAVLGVVLVLCTWWRVPTDYMLRMSSIDDREVKQIYDYRMMHIAGLLPGLVLLWMQIGVLTAVSVSISTRVSLVVNLPIVILVYIAGNLTRFLFPQPDDRSPILKGIAYVVSLVLPYLQVFDLQSKTIYGKVRLPGTQFFDDINGTFMSEIWGYVGIAGLNAACYAAFALAVGMWLFSTRELGGAEG